MPDFSFPLRTVHLDFHTGPEVPDVARDFAAERFAQTFKDAHVDSVTVFATCHHGHAYYRTGHPCRHPNLPPGLDLTGSQIEALRRAGLRAPIYISGQVNEYAANTHPEWVAIDPDGRRVKHLPRDWPGDQGAALHAGWQVLDMSSPYQEYLAEQIEEILDLYRPVDGIFLDMCWDQPSVSRWALEGMARRNLDPRLAEHRARYARQVALDYMRRFSAMVEAAGAGADHFGIWFNSRPKTNLQVEKQFLRRVEIEALPTGGWGYAYFPYVARFVRPFGLPTLTHTGRFFKSWGDNAGLKPPAALKYECCQALSQGMTAGIGDLLHPRGVPQAAVYDLIGGVYAHLEACEPFVAGGAVLSQIALLVDPELGDDPGAAGLGATRALQQLRQQFDVVPPDAPLDRYELVLVPETTTVDETLRAALRGYLAQGGALILSGRAGLTAQGEPVLEEQGVRGCGPSPFSHTFLRPAAAVADGIPNYDHVTYESGPRIRPAGAAEPLVGVVEPYFERHFARFSGHSYTPPAHVSPYSAVVRNGRVITFALPILGTYGRHAVPAHRRLLGNCIDLLLPAPLLRAPGAPSLLETSVVRAGTRTVVHLLCFARERRSESFDQPRGRAQGLDIVEDAVPLLDQRLAVKLPAAPRRAALQPHGAALPVEYRAGYAHVRVTLRDGHGMVVFDAQ